MVGVVVTARFRYMDKIYACISCMSAFYYYSKQRGYLGFQQHMET